MPLRVASEFVYTCTGFKAGRVQTCDSAGFNQCLMDFLLLSLHVCSFSSFSDTNKVFFFPATAVSAFLVRSLQKPLRKPQCAKNPSRSAAVFRSGARLAPGTAFKVTSIPFIAHFDAHYELPPSPRPNLKYIALLPCHWLVR